MIINYKTKYFLFVTDPLPLPPLIRMLVFTRIAKLFLWVSMNDFTLQILTD